MEYELIVRGGTVVDGSGAPRFPADIAIDAGRIAEVIADRESDQVNAVREIDHRPAFSLGLGRADSGTRRDS